MGMELFGSVNYRSPVNFIHSRFIREYDIKKANISILYKYGVIDENTYKRLYNSSREIRQIEIGLMEKYNPEVYKILANGIIEAKKELFQTNSIQDHEVLSIKNDAVFILDRQLQYTKFGIVEFVPKNTYTSYMNLNKIEVLYGLDKISNKETIDVKGIGKCIDLHREYFLDFIAFVMSSIETEDIETVISSFCDFYKDYVELKLPINYYREFNSDSKYRITNSMYAVSSLLDTDENRRCLDISYNLYLLRIIHGYLTSTFFEVKRK